VHSAICINLVISSVVLFSPVRRTMKRSAGRCQKSALLAQRARPVRALYARPSNPAVPFISAPTHADGARPPSSRSRWPRRHARHLAAVESFMVGFAVAGMGSRWLWGSDLHRARDTRPRGPRTSASSGPMDPLRRRRPRRSTGSSRWTSRTSSTGNTSRGLFGCLAARRFGRQLAELIGPDRHRQAAQEGLRVPANRRKRDPRQSRSRCEARRKDGS